MELACESVDFGRTLDNEDEEKIVLKAVEPRSWFDQNNKARLIVPATSMEVTKQKKLCSIVVYGQVLVTATKTDFGALRGHYVHTPEPFSGIETHEFFMTGPYILP